jgi:FemAB-related protein (PEP-CTERM system-associated)
MMAQRRQATAIDQAGHSRVEIRLITDREAWDSYAALHPGGTFYHRFEWLCLITRVFGHETFAVGAVVGDRVVGILPLVLMDSALFGRFLVSMPFLNYGGVLGDTEDIERSLWEYGVSVARERQATSLEARHQTTHAFVTETKRHKVTMVLALAPSIEAQWKAFGAKLRNQIRKAEASGLTVTVGGASESQEFYDVFARNMRDLGTPVYSRRFFEDVLRTFPESTRVFTVRRHETVVAAGISLAHRETLEVPWAASRRDARAWCPNHRLYWELLQHGIKSGFGRFDFGRSTPGSGPYKFKEQWGALEVPLFWEYWTANGAVPELNPHNPRYAAAVRLWKRLPLAVANRVGPLIVRNIP